ncbi:hypothetical protein HYALB_00001956 [Hymenoscyphus albidus]|uniref:Ankyrin repeat protein n=1 Tax=Hymenoscyphus albidus TaxID=595503 RepID=A0A9N9LEU5_9HELO|nr:hypothetical protein HYALB_00001956 [Hymenoscyphus albidus]
MASPPVLMVDQCWLWVIGDTVVTCFPNSWAEDVIPNNIGDPLDLLEKIVQDLNERSKYENITTSQKFATIIIDHCASNVYDLGMESNKQSDKFHFLELFYRSIREMMAAQTDLFDKFCNDSSRFQEVQLSMQKVREPNTPGTPGDITDPELEELKKELHELQQPRTGSLFDITVEITKLREIMDIQDELHMIEDVLEQQIRAILRLDDVLHFKRDNSAPDLLSKIENRRGMIAQLQADAQRPYEGANASEARSGRQQAEQATLQATLQAKQAEATTRQGTSIMLFTTVTILFLPLSTLSSIFGLNAKDLNDGNIAISVVFAYIFPLSLFIVIMAFLLVFHEGVRIFFTLYVTKALQKIHTLSGFSKFFHADRVSKWKEKLEEMRNEEAAPSGRSET